MTKALKKQTVLPDAVSVHKYLEVVIQNTPGALTAYKDDFYVHDLKILNKLKPGDEMFWGVYHCGTHAIVFTHPTNDESQGQEKRWTLQYAEAIHNSYSTQFLACRQIRRRHENSYVVSDTTIEEALALAKEKARS